MSYRSDGGGPAAPASGHGAVATPQPSPHKAVAQRPPATRRDSGGAEARAPYRRRRAHSHQPGLCSDKWGASCPDGGAVAGARRLGRRRSDGGLGPTKPVQPLKAPPRWAPSLTRHPPAATPQPSPHKAVAQRPQGQHQRPQGRHGCLVPGPGDARLLRGAPPQAAPHRATLSSRTCGRPSRLQPAHQQTQTAVNQRRTIQQPRQGRPRQETIAVLPPGQLQKTTKNTKQSYKGRLIKQHFC